MLSAPVGLSNELSCEAGSFSCCLLNPHGCFQSEVSGFISPRWSPGLHSLLCSPPFIPVYLCKSVGPRCATHALPAPFSATLSPALSVYLHVCGATGSASGQTACPLADCLLVNRLPVRPTLCQSQSRHGNSSPLRPGCPSPPLLPVWMNVYFLFP